MINCDFLRLRNSLKTSLYYKDINRSLFHWDILSDFGMKVIRRPIFVYLKFWLRCSCVMVRCMPKQRLSPDC